MGFGRVLGARAVRDSPDRRNLLSFRQQLRRTCVKLQKLSQKLLARLLGSLGKLGHLAHAGQI